MTDRPPSYLSCGSLARELDVSESTVWEMVRRGVLPKPIKLSAGCSRFDWFAVQLALNSLSAGNSASEQDPFMAGARNATAEG